MEPPTTPRPRRRSRSVCCRSTRPRESSISRRRAAPSTFPTTRSPRPPTPALSASSREAAPAKTTCRVSPLPSTSRRGAPSLPSSRASSMAPRRAPPPARPCGASRSALPPAASAAPLSASSPRTAAAGRARWPRPSPSHSSHATTCHTLRPRARPSTCRTPKTRCRGPSRCPSQRASTLGVAARRAGSRSPLRSLASQTQQATCSPRPPVSSAAPGRARPQTWSLSSSPAHLGTPPTTPTSSTMATPLARVSCAASRAPSPSASPLPSPMSMTHPPSPSATRASTSPRPRPAGRSAGPSLAARPHPRPTRTAGLATPRAASATP
mmetsp:Transcript_7097/g.18030  ORF Transcript_7097/g.18030 Transcript_7097/m.18030 type:complete len:325 (+) Transcript_7097:251-1225(+)